MDLKQRDLKQDSKSSNRRGFLKGGAALAGLAAGAVQSAKAQPPVAELRAKGTSKEQVAYGDRSKYETSVRKSVAERASPDAFGLVFHVNAPLQDFYGSISPSSLHYVATHRGAFVPDIDPKEHRVMIHGMVDRPLIFTMDDLKRLPFVTRQHFVECAGNRAKSTQTTVQETHGLTSNAEYTGVLLSTLLKECGVQKGASWIVAEGAEEVKGAGSIPLGKAMDDCLVAYGQNGEALRPQQGYPVRLMVPGFEGIFQIKYLRRIKVVDQFYMTYNDYGHITTDARAAALANQVGPKSVITFPSGGQKLPGPGYYEISGLAWSGQGAIKKVEVSTDGGKTWKDGELRTTPYRMAHTRFGFHWKWDGKACEILSRCTDELGTVQPSRAQVAKYWNEPLTKGFRAKGMDNTIMAWRIDAEGSIHNGLA